MRGGGNSSAHRRRSLLMPLLGVLTLCWIVFGLGGSTPPVVAPPPILSRVATPTPLGEGEGAGNATTATTTYVETVAGVPGRFTIVMLSYKAPKSLTSTIQSLGATGVFAHPALEEVLVYFQVRQASDDALVKRAIESAISREDSVMQRLGVGAPRFRVLGDGTNHPVAEATFAAMREVRTKYVLYLECDRPAFPYSDPVQVSTAAELHAVRQIDAALRFLERGLADVFRLQLYSNPELSEPLASTEAAAAAGGVTQRRSPLDLYSVPAKRGLDASTASVGDIVLPDDIYGRDTEQSCASAPTLTPEYCRQAKMNRGRVFHTAYCKHWVKFASVRPQQDLCDAFCFSNWAVGSNTRKARTAVADKIQRVRLYSESATLLAAMSNATESSTADVACMTSEECNWTNQPTMYALAWYQQNMIDPCSVDRKGCVGSPGRRSAVLQEQFFVKHREVWAERRHRICLHRRGLFFHNEVDNRE